MTAQIMVGLGRKICGARGRAGVSVAVVVVLVMERLIFQTPQCFY